MKSGLEGRNNSAGSPHHRSARPGVSMKSGLEGRNNMGSSVELGGEQFVSMKSGLEGRNNARLKRPP